jgi:hypothetical protein
VSQHFTPHRILDVGAHVGEFHTLAKDTYPNSYVNSYMESIGFSLKETLGYGFHPEKPAIIQNDILYINNNV